VFTLQDSELERSTKVIEAEIKNNKIRDEMEISKAKQLAGIDTEKFENMVKAIGPETIKAIANAGPQMQVGSRETIYTYPLPYHTTSYHTNTTHTPRFITTVLNHDTQPRYSYTILSHRLYHPSPYQCDP
jgi:hypothetical protein